MRGDFWLDFLAIQRISFGVHVLQEKLFWKNMLVLFENKNKNMFLKKTKIFEIFGGKSKFREKSGKSKFSEKTKIENLIFFQKKIKKILFFP